MLVSVEKWRDSYDHLVNKDAQRPPIYGVVVAISDEHFRGQVLSSAAERVGELAVLDELGQAKVSYEQVT